MTRRDLHTNEEFVPRRINQLFATSANRIAYHNKKANELRHSAAFIDKPLHTNLRILNELMHNQKEKTFHKQYLLGKGFSFKVHNHINAHAGGKHYAIYQYTIVVLANDQIKIVKND
ncbi:MAG: hypothetical protein KAY50_08825 [Chitinophagaceae bacterium]|nr:hypothetical protein [Chitinophagaceae bacterium]